MSDPYLSDEYEDYDDYDFYEDYGEIETSYTCEVRKAANGQLYLFEGMLTRYPGEDWGEASGWHERALSLNQLRPHVKARCIELGRDLKPGEDTHYYEDDDDDESEYHGTFENPGNTTLPADYIPF